MADQSFADLSNITLKFTESIQQQANSIILSLKVPEFSGLVEEDARDFIGQFKAATLTLNDEMKCLAIQKSLKGTAKIWAKANLKDVINEGNWKKLKQLLLERFEGSNVYIRHLEKLSKLRFDINENGSLLSYIEKYADFYKQAHPDAIEANIILSLRLNLSDRVQKALNIIDDNWTSFKSMSEMYVLARRAEEKILAYEKEKTDESLKPQELVKMMKDLKNILKETRKKKDEVNKEIVAAAFVKRDNQNFNKIESNRYNHGQRYQPYQERDDKYKKSFSKYPQFNRDNESMENTDRIHTSLSKNRSSNLNKKQEPLNSFAKGSQDDYAYSKYVAKFGEPPGPCFHCKGKHFNKHCPLRNLN